MKGSTHNSLALVTRTSTSSPLNCLCAAQASLYQHSISVLGVFVERLCLCLTAVKLARRRWRLAASNALLALRRLFGSKVFHLATLLSPGLASFCSRCQLSLR